MSLPSGTPLGPYEVLAPLGAGGMGEVYRARDTRLGREVAVKVLTDDLADDPRALARFQAEARAVAALSHANILALHDVGEEGGLRYAVTELLEGETLRALLRRGAIPVRRALEIAGQVAEGLAAAHEAGIVHRDVKPENVFLTKDGRVKVLDFGLARHRPTSSSPGGEDTPTASVLTDPGTVLGTFAYMSPEQASGKPVDHRSDQFSLGVVLYEMLTGKRPFGGATAAETLAAVIREEPEPLEVGAPKVPAPVRWLVDRLLAKDPHGRYDTTRDLARELKTVGFHASSSRGMPVSPGIARPRRARLALGAAAVAVLAAAPFAILLLEERQRPGPASARLEVRLPAGYFLSYHRGAVALSPDGRLLVFSAFAWKRPYAERDEPRLFLRPLDSFEARPIPGSEGGVQPAFSPDGRHVAFAGETRDGPFLRRVALDGGNVQTICACSATFGIAWSPDGSILFAAEHGPIQKVPAGGGTPEPATSLDVQAGEVSHRLPHLLPDGQTVLYTALRWGTLPRWERARIYASRLGETARSLLVEGGSDGRWAPPGTLVFAREGKILAAPLDAGATRVTGQPFVVLDGVRHVTRMGDSTSESGIAHVALSSEGLLAWGPGSVNPPSGRTRVWVDATGKETPFEERPSGEPTLGNRVSRDGKRALLSYYYPGLEAEVADFARGGRQRVTFDANARWAIWGPGPDRITFTSDREGPARITTRRLDAGPGEIENSWNVPDSLMPALGSWSPDGKLLAFIGTSRETRHDIWLLEAGGKARPFVATRFDEMWPDISPDGRWLLYSSDASGRMEVFARSLSGEGGTLQVSTGDGVEPLWSRDGRSVYYWGGGTAEATRTALFRVPVTRAQGSLSFGVPARLFEGRYAWANPGHMWDVSPDGRFLVVKALDETALRAYLDSILTDRILVDTGGLATLLEEAGRGR